MARRGPHLSSKLRRSYSVVDKLVRLWTGIKILCLPIFSPRMFFFPQERRIHSRNSQRALCLHGDRANDGCQRSLVARQLQHNHNAGDL